jgi:hypothetical protein
MRFTPAAHQEEHFRSARPNRVSGPTCEILLAGVEISGRMNRLEKSIVLFLFRQAAQIG